VLDNEKDLEPLKATSATDRVKEAIINLLYVTLTRYDYLLRQSDSSGGQQKAKTNFNAGVNTLYEFLRPRIIKKSVNNHDYDYYYKELDELANKGETTLLLRSLLDYLENDLELTRIDFKKEVDIRSIKGF
jgi:hypothetical protein